MIYKATIEDIHTVATLLKELYNEIEPELSSKEYGLYLELGTDHLLDDIVYIYGGDKALFIMRDVSSPVIDKQMWDGVSVYIRPEYRNSTILKELYDYMFKHFDGTILGFVEPNSKHYKVLQKRHKLLGYVYQLNRSK